MQPREIQIIPIGDEPVALLAWGWHDATAFWIATRRMWKELFHSVEADNEVDEFMELGSLEHVYATGPPDMESNDEYAWQPAAQTGYREATVVEL